ncbi:MAG: GNAT family N-acetyltransferase [Oscillospiraceae bacterium]|nr:GNAT family N-acetyltransferase [Candidatus Ruminococcus equi]
MSVELVRIGLDEAENLWKMQVEAFTELYNKYKDTDTSPATEKLEKMITRLKQPFTYYYYIQDNGINVGAIRIVDEKDNTKSKRISPIFIMPQHRNKGYAQIAIRMVENLHGDSNWELDTILQEKGNCYLYEKLGYHQTGKTHIINDKLTLVFYIKE